VGDEFDSILGADISPDQARIAMGGPGRLVKVFNTGTGAVEHKLKKHTDWVTAIAFSPDGQFLASGDRNGGISIWDPDNGQEVFTLAGHKAGVTALSWRSDGKLLASSGEDGAVKLWEMQEGRQAKTWEAHKGGALSVSYGMDGRLVSSGRDNAVILWSGDGARIRTFSFAGELPTRATLSHDGTRVVAADWNGRLTAWNTADGKLAGAVATNPAKLATRVAASEKRIRELEAIVPTPAKELERARAEHQRLMSALSRKG
jgi:WD40 repeat protein